MTKKSASALSLMACSLGILLGASSCSTPAAKGEAEARRSPAGSRPVALEAEHPETSFQALLRGSGPASRLKRELSRQASLYFYAEALVLEFDAKLDEALRQGRESPLHSPLYERLLATYYSKRHHQGLLVYFYRRLFETERDSVADREIRSKARRARLAFEKELARQGALERIALSELAGGLSEVRAAFGLKRHASQDPSSTLEELRKNRKAMDQRAREERARNQALGQELEFLAAEFPPVRPSPDKSGNINGSGFPRGTWALTFDDGPSSTHTPVILDHLKTQGIQATFFWVAENAILSESLPWIQEASRAGHTLGHHSYTHANLPKQPDARLEREIVEAGRRLTEVYGEKPRFFRAPYGAGVHDARVRGVIAREGMIHVSWNVDSLDWQDKDPESVLARVEKEMAIQKRGIVLFHDIHPQSAKASALLLAKTAGKLRWRTISEIVDELNSGSP